MAVEPEHVLRAAELARLELSEAEVDRLVSDLAEILDHVDALAAVDAPPAPDAATRDATPTRRDEPGGDPLAFPPADFAPAFRDGLFLVPRLASHDPAAEP